MKQQKRMKKGITLIEIILAIVLIAVILGIAIPKLMTNSSQAEIKQTVVSDVKSIVEAASLWRRSSAQAQGSYENVSANEIFSRLPSSMFVDRARGLIYSAGLNTGQQDATTNANNTGVIYTIMWDFTQDANNPASTTSFAIGINTTPGGEELGWDARMQEYAMDVFEDALFDISNGQSSTYTATDRNSNGTANQVNYECSGDQNQFRCVESITTIN